MTKKRIATIAFLAIAVAVATVWMRRSPAVRPPPVQSPAVQSPCEVATNPKSFDGKTLRIRGTLSVHFEDFTLSSGNCAAQTGIWLAFGGDVPGIVASTTNDSGRKPGVDPKVNDVAYRIKKDENFRKLYALIAARPDGNKPAYTVTATLTGAFFAGHEGQTLPGYGHLGCCFLFVITAVEDVESIPPANLRVRGTVLRPDGTRADGFTVFSDILGGAPPHRQRATTNDRGEFEFLYSGEMLRFEDPSYRPIALPVKAGGPPVSVRLENAQGSDWQVATCPTGKNPARIGFEILFTLPQTMEAEAFSSGNTQSYFVFPSGSSASLAELIISKKDSNEGFLQFVADLKPPEQRWIKDKKGTVVGLDSRGQLKNGWLFRQVIFKGKDGAWYQVAAGKRTTLLDATLDSACMANPA